MRSFFGFLCVALTTSVIVFGQEIDGTSSNQVLVALGMNPSDPFVHSYYVDRLKVPSKVSWEPNQIPFPVDLGAEAVSATGFLVARVQTNDFKLGMIYVSPALLAPEWLVDFRFFVGPYVLTNLDVEMLLDGTYAAERLRPKSKSEVLSDEQHAHERFMRKPDTPRQVAILSDTNVYIQTQETLTKTNAFDLVKLVDFVLPRVQWKWGEPFPVDLGAGVIQAQACLSHPESFVLRQIVIQRYHPEGAIGHSSEMFLNNLDHWLIEYRFNSSAEKTVYRVYMLLDRRILCVTSEDY